MSDLEAAPEAAALRKDLHEALMLWVSPYQYSALFDGIISSVLPVVESFLSSCRSGRDTERAERLAAQERIRALADEWDADARDEANDSYAAAFIDCAQELRRALLPVVSEGLVKP